ncbi:hypothetical protein FDP41_006508 [Naegleria fowleri]|uniref:Uncharacterized protein n=1 Tax=Naegleria fowleri TaxID=5763 RepID=A0A6A5BI89_NAEFO|nr:uncharacterized protein FDP41_006508 [Naegleria fowleri]KAF0974476.1 hypothetical protein FDP41_006508 [Naegleria fowleri]
MKKLCVIRVVVGSSPAAAALTLKKKLTVGYCSSQQHLNSSSLVQLLWSSQVPQPLFLNSFRNFQTLSSRNSSISNDTKFKEQQHDDTSSTATATSTSSSPTTEQTSSSTPPTKNVISEEEEPITSNHRNNQRNTPPLKRKIISSSSSSSFHKLSKTLFWIALTTVGTVIIFSFL